MKEKYFKPTVYIEEFKTIDIITTSDIDDTQKGDTDIEFGEDLWANNYLLFQY